MIPPVTQAPGNRGPSWTPTLTLAAKPPVSNRRPTPPSPRHLPPDNTWCWALWGLRENPSSQQRAALPRQPGGSTACPSPPPRALSSWRRGSQASAPQPGAQQGPVGGALCPVTTLLVWADLLPPRWPGRPLPLPEPEASEGSREAPERRQELEPPASWKPLGGSSQRVWEPRGHPGCWRDGQGCPGWLCGQGPRPCPGRAGSLMCGPWSPQSTCLLLRGSLGRRSLTTSLVIPAKPPDAPITGHRELSRWPRLFLGLEGVPGRRTPPAGVAAGAWGRPCFLSRGRRTCSGLPWPPGSQGWVREPQIHSRGAGDKLRPGREGAQPRSLDAKQGPFLSPHVTGRPSRRGSSGPAPGALSNGGAARQEDPGS